MDRQSKQGDWLNSKEACEKLKISSCDLSHIRENGKLQYKKEGNAFRYSKKDVQNLKKAMGK